MLKFQACFLSLTLNYLFFTKFTLVILKGLLNEYDCRSKWRMGIPLG
jgi:hypothetical protein